VDNDYSGVMNRPKQARKALYAARVDVLTKETDELAREALAEIDKVMGGKEW